MVARGFRHPGADATRAFNRPAMGCFIPAVMVALGRLQPLAIAQFDR